MGTAHDIIPHSPGLYANECREEARAASELNLGQAAVHGHAGLIPIEQLPVLSLQYQDMYLYLHLGTGTCSMPGGGTRSGRSSILTPNLGCADGGLSRAYIDKG